MPLPTLHTDLVTLRPLQTDDLEPLAAFIAHPSVRRWWDFIGDPDTIREGLENEGRAFAIETPDRTVAGWLGFAEEDDPDYRFASLDLMLGPAHQGRGLGPGALQTAICWLIDERSHRRFTIDPAAANERAIRAYATVGFKPVGRMREYARSVDGTWQDALLMDLLAAEL